MDDVKNQLVKDVAELKQFQITEGRVREIVKAELESLPIRMTEIVKAELESLPITVREIVKAELVAAAPPPERKRLFKSSLKKKSQAETRGDLV